MSGVPVYTQSPIRAAAKPSGVTPQTATQEERYHSTEPNPAPATTTAIATPSYPSAQPGAAAPVPTAAASRYAPLQPTPTTQSEPSGPPAPQPGAFPIPQKKSDLPPPPKAGESFHPQTPTKAPRQPPQMAIPSPSTAIGAHPPASSTMTVNTPSQSYPVSLPFTEAGGAQANINHPPGYQQNAYASDFTPEQRRAREAQDGLTSHQNSSMNGSSQEDDSYWNTARNWAQQAGDKLQAAEAEVWKRINKQ